MKGNAGVYMRENSSQKPPADHWHGREQYEKTTNARNRKVTSPTAPRGGEVFSRNIIENTQHNKTKTYYTDPYIAPHHVTREQGTLVAPRLWADEGVGRANLNEHEKTDSPAPQIATRLPRPWPDTERRGGGRTKFKYVKKRPTSSQNARNTTNNSKTRTPNLITQTKKKRKISEEWWRHGSQLATTARRDSSTLRRIPRGNAMAMWTCRH